MKSILLLSIALFITSCATVRDVGVIAGPDLVARYVTENPEIGDTFLAVADALEGKPADLDRENDEYIEIAGYIAKRLMEEYGEEADSELIASVLRVGVARARGKEGSSK